MANQMTLELTDGEAFETDYGTIWYKQTDTDVWVTKIEKGDKPNIVGLFRRFKEEICKPEKTVHVYANGPLSEFFLKHPDEYEFEFASFVLIQKGNGNASRI